MTRTQLKWATIGVALVLLGAVKFALISWYLSRPAEAAVQEVACDPAQTSCRLPNGMQLQFASAPRSGLPFQIQLTGAAKEAPGAEFSMRDMDMGFNRYRFVAAPGGWQARVTLPMCVSQRQDWIMTLEVEGQRYRLPFRTS
ncbi:hypothetical protein [Pseudogulbenkiania subflava]|uniref:Uncharacterized protein n=1 Tax=Pseudogulbenkiania subflava DSM 22618 TaxID=1123014 RepID=A0A1Y6BDI1_9NEIS|nr:hypothetical protein [Pseudogulbenkiania subflava]SME98283.1 hypothetical protein SAMN02745746_00501 [Pseudogulbenkiania subflava DSM 22618]